MLTYHSIGASQLGLPEPSFREQMRWLAENVSVLDLEELIKGDWPANRSGLYCAITFDDGYESVYRYAFPVLNEHGFPATVYLVTDAIGETDSKNSNEFDGLYPSEPMLRWAQVKEMFRTKVSFGSHLMRHKQLPALNDDAARVELSGSKRKIEDQLGIGCTSFCYPWGKHDDRVVGLVRDAGYSNAVIAIHRRWVQGELPATFRIPRLDVRREYTLEDFAAVVCGDWDYLGYQQRFRSP